MTIYSGHIALICIYVVYYDKISNLKGAGRYVRQQSDRNSTEMA